MLIYKVLSVLGFGYWGLLALCCVCYDRKCILHFPMFGTTKNASQPKMSHTKQITSNKFHTANVFFFFFFAHFQGYNKTHENEWFFQKNISIKWVIFQSTSSDEPNRVLVLFFSPFILFLSVILFTILLMCYKARWVFFTIILQLKSFKLKIHKSS